MNLTSQKRLPVRLLMDAIDGLSDPILLLYPDLELHHLNSAAEALFQRPDPGRERTGQRASECLSELMAGRPCGGTDHCPGCRLWRALRISLARGETVGPVPFERSIELNGRPQTRHYDVMAHPFRTNGELGMLVTLQQVARQSATTDAGPSAREADA